MSAYIFHVRYVICSISISISHTEGCSLEISNKKGEVDVALWPLLITPLFNAPNFLSTSWRPAFILEFIFNRGLSFSLKITLLALCSRAEFEPVPASRLELNWSESLSEIVLQRKSLKRHVSFKGCSLTKFLAVKR